MSQMDLRASDADRERAALLLRDAAADGRLTVDELSERLELAYAARTSPELDVLTRDLAAAAVPVPTRRNRRFAIAVMSGASLRGRIRLDALRAIAVMGGLEIDLREAELVGDETTIDVCAIMGGVEITVPPGVEVDAHGLLPFMGGRDVHVPAAPPGAHRIRIRGLVLMAGLEVRVRQTSSTSPS